MSQLRVVPIVEGDGEVESIKTLLRRVWRELLGGDFIEVREPIQKGRGQLVRRDELQKACRLAFHKVNGPPVTDAPKLVLVRVDADDDRPCELGPKLLKDASETDSRLDVACVVANLEYETWFAAAAESLTGYLELPPGFRASEDPEGSRHKKAWVQQHFRGSRADGSLGQPPGRRAKYSETQDQPAMTRAMDLALCRRRSPSFDKLCRELERRLRRGDRVG